MTPDQKIRCFITTGDHDMLHGAWSGDNFLARANTADSMLRSALIDEVRRWTNRAELVSILTEAVDARNGWKLILRRCKG